MFKMMIFSITHTFIVYFLSSKSYNVSSPKSLRVKMIIIALQIIPIMDILSPYMVGEGGRGGGLLSLKHENVGHVGDFISNPLVQHTILVSLKH